MRSIIRITAASLLLLTCVPAHAASKVVFTTPFVTRAESAMLLLQARLPHIPALKSEGKFSDVKEGSWYERYMVLGERLAIIQSNPVTKAMRPDDPVTRAEFLLMAVRTFGINTDLYPSTYRDVAKESWYGSIAGVAQQLKLFPDDADKSLFNADSPMVHTEVARAVQTLLALSMVEDPVPVAAPEPEKTYLVISSKTLRNPMIKPRGATPHAAPGSTPLLTTNGRAGDDPKQLPLLRDSLLRLVNEARAQAKLSPLNIHPGLEESAQKYARELIEKNFFGHVSPTGGTLRERIQDSGYYKPFFDMDCLCVRQYIVGENLARGQRTASEVVREWLASPGHKAAMLNGSFTDAGIGITSGVWVMHFGGEQK